VIIVRESRLNPVDRIVEYLDPTQPIDLEPRVYTVEEIVKMAVDKRRIIKEIVEYGKVLAGDEKIIEDLKTYTMEIRARSPSNANHILDFHLIYKCLQYYS